MKTLLIVLFAAVILAFVARDFVIPASPPAAGSTPVIKDGWGIQPRPDPWDSRNRDLDKHLDQQRRDTFNNLYR